MYLEIWCEDVLLPSPESISHADETIWDAETGRATDGLMIGDIIAEKETITVEWKMVTLEEYILIRDTLPTKDEPFKQITVKTNTGIVCHTYMGYRSTITNPKYICAGEDVYCQSLSTDLIQQ